MSSNHTTIELDDAVFTLCDKFEVTAKHLSVILKGNGFQVQVFVNVLSYVAQ